jgi:hypothetical protein
MLGVAAKLVERLGRKIAKVRMLAQDRQFDAPRLGRDIRQFACPVAAHEQRIGRSLRLTSERIDCCWFRSSPSRENGSHESNAMDFCGLLRPRRQRPRHAPPSSTDMNALRRMRIAM